MVQQLLSTAMGRLRIIGFLEGVSYLVLLLIAMPLKYLAGQPEAVLYTGMAHGVLFVLYILLVAQVGYLHKWPFFRVLIAMAASLIPIGTFWIDAKYLKDAPQLAEQR